MQIGAIVTSLIFFLLYIKVDTYSLQWSISYHFGQDLIYQRDIKYDSLSYIYNKLYHLNWLLARFSSEMVWV
jgi:hypothetical protein